MTSCIHETQLQRCRVFPVSVKSQTLLPKQDREALDVRPGDTLRHRITGQSGLIDKAHRAIDADDPFAAFAEWSGAARNEVMATSVRPAKIACIEPGGVVRRAGTLDARHASLVAARLGGFFAKRRAPTR